MISSSFGVMVAGGDSASWVLVILWFAISILFTVGLHPGGRQSLWLPSFRTKGRAQSQHRDISDLMDGGILYV